MCKVRIMDRLSEMLDMQRDLQVTAYHRDPSTLDISDKIQFIKDMHIAITDELHELLGEVDWKPWTHGDRGINYAGAKKELVDVWHFFMNLMIVLDVTPDELFAFYTKKRQVNINRQNNEYDGVSTKCPKCKRALEDVVLYEVTIDTGIIVLCECNQEIPFDVAKPFLTE